ncbi:MAG TPA: rRNA maturation RNase YbeY [Chitinophagaceae bacterium]|nr:rRNA maturation RNase YbeY [Chitinophagaceae bacterium]
MTDLLKSKVYFFSLNVKASIYKRQNLKRFIENLFKSEKKKIDRVNYIFCSDDYLLKISKTYLNHSSYTDIITFRFSPKKDAIEGEIYISVDRVKENTKRFNVSFKNEIHRVIFHGALHLCGYEDKTKLEKRIMVKKENLYLSLYFKTGLKH